MCIRDSFCVMDEIEAALDEANVVRYARYMRRIAGKTQFIVITHRRGTMEAVSYTHLDVYKRQGLKDSLREMFRRKPSEEE